LTEQIDLKLDESQVQTMLDAYEPYTSESPISIFTARDTGARILKMDSTYSSNLLAKASVASVTALGTAVFDEINTRLSGYLTPSKIEITSNFWSQVQINSTSDTTDPSEIGFSRENKSQFLKSAMGVSGDLTRGAFWWAGGEDRININCETGVVRLKNGIVVPIIKTDTIQCLTPESILRIEDRLAVGGSVNFESYIGVNGVFAAFGDSAFSRNVTIAGNLTTTGTISASNSNPFWVAGVYDGFNMTRTATKGRYGYSVARAGGFAAGVYAITFDTPYNSANYVINLTNQSTGHCKIWDSALPTVNGFHVVIFDTSNALANSVFHFSVIA
jgi:hypothetical protein